MDPAGRDGGLVFAGADVQQVCRRPGLDRRTIGGEATIRDRRGRGRFRPRERLGPGSEERLRSLRHRDPRVWMKIDEGKRGGGTHHREKHLIVRIRYVDGGGRVVLARTGRTTVRTATQRAKADPHDRHAVGLPLREQHAPASRIDRDRIVRLREPCGKRGQQPQIGAEKQVAASRRRSRRILQQHDERALVRRRQGARAGRSEPGDRAASLERVDQVKQGAGALQQSRPAAATGFGEAIRQRQQSGESRAHDAARIRSGRISGEGVDARRYP